MSISVRKGTGEVERALVAQYNALRASVAVAGTKFHNDVTSKGTTGSFESLAAAANLVESPNASSLATSLTLVNEIKTKYIAHRDDVVAHKADDATVIAAADATDLATAQTLANELKADYNTHIASTSYHHSADGTNAVAAADASDQATLNTLLNEMKADFNAHIQSAPAGASLVLTDP